ncbi:conserved hypothetical protein [Acidithiobacillus caldus SM-1]|uniref:Uncharacterized protein n=2 Tax=Acidithiobacillus caldus TaxID=33059 RepID=F9ZQD7_ACICS|nr:conserved hypothetical protein [Acidithiobacillus caldus SM-1]AIA55322.1 hypothetical protein Acaty_c1456 [Acidithiobacillus caldus ATCC 51756]QER45768.1 hypothetical protein F0726_02716 [Acidithiobacillus caldus]
MLLKASIVSVLGRQATLLSRASARLTHFPAQLSPRVYTASNQIIVPTTLSYFMSY